MSSRFGLGFGALWYGVYSRAPKEEQVRRFLNLPEGVEVLGITIIGAAAEKNYPKRGVKEERLHFGCWQE